VMAFSMASIGPRPDPPGQAPTALFSPGLARRRPRARRVTPYTHQDQQKTQSIWQWVLTQEELTT
jgi:hypothetical protein